jgi:hypothetical protein
MHDTQYVGHVVCQSQRLGQGERLTPLEPVTEGLPFEVLHDDEGLPVGKDVTIKNLDDARVVDHGGGAGFVEESADRLGIQRQFRAQQLHRGFLSDVLVLAEVHDAHRAGSQ